MMVGFLRGHRFGEMPVPEPLTGILPFYHCIEMMEYTRTQNVCIHMMYLLPEGGWSHCEIVINE